MLKKSMATSDSGESLCQRAVACILSDPRCRQSRPMYFIPAAFPRAGLPSLLPTSQLTGTSYHLSMPGMQGLKGAR